jgi:hypothetical protein
MAKFRFQDLKILQLATRIKNEISDIADDLEQKKRCRFTDCLSRQTNTNAFYKLTSAPSPSPSTCRGRGWGEGESAGMGKELMRMY